MSTNKSNINTKGLFIVLLQILFIGLKLPNVIKWSWFWILSPLWIPIAAILFIAIIGGLGAGIIKVFSSKYDVVEMDDDYNKFLMQKAIKKAQEKAILQIKLNKN